MWSLKNNDIRTKQNKTNKQKAKHLATGYIAIYSHDEIKHTLLRISVFTQELFRNIWHIF